MRFLFKVIILFLIVFNFRVPYLYNTAFVSIALCWIYYISNRRKVPFNFFFQRYNIVILIGVLSVIVVVIIVALMHGTNAFEPQRRYWIVFMMLGSVIFAMPLLVEGKESSAIEEISIVICCAFALQGVTCLTAYLYPPLADLFMKIKPEDIATAIKTANVDNKFRYLSLSGVLLVELTAIFGVSFIVFFWMQLKYNHPYMRGWRKYLLFCFIFLGTVFAGRTGFFGFLFGLAGWLYFSFGKLLKILERNLGYIVSVTAILLFIFYFVLSSRQRQSFNDEVFPFAFEWYYNYRDYGKFEVASMEMTHEHYFYLYDETLLYGHGISAYDLSSPYPHSDAGYTNKLIYGGIPFLAFLIICQFLYFARPLAVTLKNKSREGKIDCVFFLILFIYVFFVEIKAPAISYLHSLQVMYLALGSSYLYSYYLQRKQDKLNI